MTPTPTSNPLSVNSYPGQWGYSPDRGLWAQVFTPHGELTAGDDGTHLATFGALAAALDCHDLIDELGLTFPDIVAAVEDCWALVEGGPGWVNSEIAYRDAARHLVGHYGLSVAVAAEHCHTWPETVLPLLPRDHLDLQLGQWWVDADSSVLRSYGGAELSSPGRDAYRRAGRVPTLAFRPLSGMVSADIAPKDLRWATPILAEDAAAILEVWGEDTDTVIDLEARIRTGS